MWLYMCIGTFVTLVWVVNISRIWTIGFNEHSLEHHRNAAYGMRDIINKFGLANVLVCTKLEMILYALNNRCINRISDLWADSVDAVHNVAAHNELQMLCIRRVVCGRQINYCILVMHELLLLVLLLLLPLLALFLLPLLLLLFIFLLLLFLLRVACCGCCLFCLVVCFWPANSFQLRFLTQGRGRVIGQSEGATSEGSEGLAEQATKTLAVNANKAKVKALQPQVRMPIHTHTHRHTHRLADRWKICKLMAKSSQITTTRRERERGRQRDGARDRDNVEGRGRMGRQARQMKTNQWATAIGNSMPVAFHDSACVAVHVNAAYVCACVCKQQSLSFSLDLIETCLWHLPLKSNKNRTSRQSLACFVFDFECKHKALCLSLSLRLSL